MSDASAAPPIPEALKLPAEQIKAMFEEACSGSSPDLSKAEFVRFVKGLLQEYTPSDSDLAAAFTLAVGLMRGT